MKHILFELRECPSELLDDSEFIVMALQGAASRAKSKLIDVNFHKFEPQGVTGLALLADSHISIHTWPEHNIAKCDIFTCSPSSKPLAAIKYLKDRFHATEVVKWTCNRSRGVDMVL